MMSKAEAGRMGGRKTAEKPGHMTKLARKVGIMLRDERPGYFSEMGQQGGQATFGKHGPGHYANLGRVGGRRLKEEKARTDPDYYQNIGRMGAEVANRTKAARRPAANQETKIA